MVDGILNRYIFTVFSYRFAILHRISVCLFIWFYNGLFFYKVYVSQSTLSSQSVSKLKKKERYQFTQVASSLLRSMWHWRRSSQCWVFVLSEGRLVFLTNESLGESVLFYAHCQQPGHTMYLDHLGLYEYLNYIVATERSSEIICKITLPALVTAHRSPVSLSPMLAAPGDGRQCLLIAYLAL